MTIKAFKDFDDFFSSVEDKPQLKIKLFGKEYFIPTSVSAASVLRGYKAVREGRANYTTEEYATFIIETLGEENVEDWSEHGLSESQLMKIFYWVIEERSKTTETGEEKDSGKKST